VSEASSERFGRRSRAIVLALFGVAAVAAILIWTTVRHTDSPPSLAERAAHNYIVLSASESHKLVSYARSEYRCLVAHGTNVSRPLASRTRITMQAPGLPARELMNAMQGCDGQVGPPPARAALQARDGLVLVYLPKQCLLDPTEVGPG